MGKDSERNKPAERQLLKSVLLNCATDGISVSPTYGKPFDLIFERAKNRIGRPKQAPNLAIGEPEPT